MFGYVKRNKYAQKEEHFRRLLRQQRIDKGLTQKALADIIGVPQSFVSKYESGERLLTFTETVTLCQALQVNPQALLMDYLSHHDT
ncbi:MAG: helix-turn-helix transcriptional regulator [Candidatus Latescibacteria bacterium]|nr:helix-turn-helix transcriptional regulator [Candidatus Latescibacterota bacterium]